MTLNKKSNANKDISRFYCLYYDLVFGHYIFACGEIKQNCNSSETVAIFFSDVVFERNRGKKDVRGIALLDLKLFACDGQRYTYRVLQTIQMKLILLCIWEQPAFLGSTKTALKFKYEI